MDDSPNNYAKKNARIKTNIYKSMYEKYNGNHINSCLGRVVKDAL